MRGAVDARARAAPGSRVAARCGLKGLGTTPTARWSPLSAEKKPLFSKAYGPISNN